MIVDVHVEKDQWLYASRCIHPLRRDGLRAVFVECGACGTALGDASLLRVGTLCRCGARVVNLLAIADSTPRVFTVAALEAQGTGPETCAAIHAHALSPSDLGLPNAIPLPANEWHPAFTDEGRAAQNRKINDLLMARAG